MGPQGMREVGETVMGNAMYAARRMGEVPGLRAPALTGPIFKEFTVDFTGTGKTVAQINDALLERGILGGKDLSAEFPELGQTALFCVTEVHRQADLDRLVSTIAEVMR